MGDWTVFGRKATCEIRYDDGGLGWSMEGSLELGHGTLTTEYNFTHHEPVARYEHVMGSVSVEPIFHFKTKKTHLQVTKRLSNAELATKINLTDKAGKLEYSMSNNLSSWTASLPFAYGTMPSQVDVSMVASRSFKFRRTEPRVEDVPVHDPEDEQR